MHSPPKNRCQGWKRRIKSATMAKKLLFFPFPSPPYPLPGLLDWRRLNYYFPWKLDRSRQESQVFLSSPHEFLLRWMKSDLPSGICSDPPSSCLSSGLCGGFAARHVEARSSNKERSWVQVFYRIVEFAANIGGLNINAEL